MIKKIMKIKKIKDISRYICSNMLLFKVIPFPYRVLRFYYALDMFGVLRRYGVGSKEYIELGFWQVPSKMRSNYLTEKILLSNNFVDTFYTKRAFDLITNKSDFNNRYARFLRRDWLCTQDSDEDAVKLFINKHTRVIVKPLLESRGIGIKIIDESQAEWLIIEKRKGIFYVVEQLIYNHSILKELNPSSLQTLRVETVIDASGACHIINCCLFVGGENSIVSNAHGGGTQWHIDIKTGIVDSDGFSCEGWTIKRLKNGREVRGIQIPHYEKLCNFVEELAFVTPEARYVGWDIAVMQDGLAVIEGNVQPGVCTQRVDGIPKLHVLESYA